MQRYFVSLAYKGTPYNGWQIQPAGNSHTVQECLQKAFSKVCKPTKVVGSSRTDTHVHACAQVAHIDLLEAVDSHVLRRKLNAVLPRSIVINNIVRVKPNAHARYHASSRRYAYYIINQRDPFATDTAYYWRQTLDVTTMNKAAQLLLGKQNFKCFCKKKSAVTHYICEVTEAVWEKSKKGYTFYIRANRFLHGMVRAIVGTLFDIGRKKLSYEDFSRIIATQDRCEASPALPAHALFLRDVHYPPTCYMDHEEHHLDDEKKM